ncbi:MAG: glycosyl transferase [Lachnospiraceae bacterium]|nr:glycosyl transferase [Lachnospiraceae bacterium]
MVGTEFINGQGLGNQLFCYVTARAAALENGYEFGTAGQERFAVNIHSDRGMYFMNVDLGHAISEEDKKKYKVCHDAEERLFIGNSKHDLTHGCYVAGASLDIQRVEDNTLIYGNMQDESYFIKYLPQVREWLKVKPEYDSCEYSRENLCIINMRGGEYTGSPELLIGRRYWLHGIAHMRKIRPDMEFMIVTDDVKTAQRMLPGIEAHHFDIAKDYVTLKNAHYLLLSNSSFACLPAFTSETVKYILAPKYWARHNVSDGYWASEQNIYTGWHYMDRKGRVFTDKECREELAAYKKKSKKYAAVNQKPTGMSLSMMKLHAWYLYKKAYLCKIGRGLERRLHGIVKRSQEKG